MCLNEDQTKRSGENKPRHLFHQRRPRLVQMSCSHEHTDITGPEELIPKTIGNRKNRLYLRVRLEDKHHLKKSADRKAQISPASGTNAFLICAFRSADFLRWCLSSKRTLTHNLFLLFPIVFGITLIHFFRWAEGLCSRKFDHLVRLFDPLSCHFDRGKTKSGILRRIGPFSKSATPLATESVNSARIFGKETKSANFWQGKV